MFYLEKQILELLPRLDFVVKFLFVCGKTVNSKMLWNREGKALFSYSMFIQVSKVKTDERLNNIKQIVQ